jgi:cytochrome c-type biogenesis protein
VELQLILISFIAGVLTILAPCIFPLLPVLISSSADSKGSRNKAVTVVVSLLITITLLTLLIYGTSNALGLNQGILRTISGFIIVSIGLVTLFPEVWEKISSKLRLATSSNKLLGKAMKKDGKAGDILIGASLGPVFSSCSPTYGLIIATILPQDPVTGTLYLLWYILGLGLMFVMIAILGKKFTSKLAWATDPNGWFKKFIGLVFLIIGIAILFNLDKSFEATLLQLDFYDSIVNFELRLNN